MGEGDGERGKQKPIQPKFEERNTNSGNVDSPERKNKGQGTSTAGALPLPSKLRYGNLLAWLLAQGGDIVPIPGTKRRKYLEENAGALQVKLTPEDLRRIDEVAPHGAASGGRYPQAMMAMVNR